MQVTGLNQFVSTGYGWFSWNSGRHVS